MVDAASLEGVAVEQARGLAAGTVKATRRKRGVVDFLTEDTPFGRSYMFDAAKKAVDKSSGGHYPAPYKIIEVLRDNYGKPRAEHLKDESAKFAELAATPVSSALIGIFKGTTEVKKHSFGSPRVPVKNVAVLGAGLMGAGIAQVSVDSGKYRVFLKDKDQAGVMRGQKVISDAMAAKLKKKKMTNHEYCATDSRLIPLHDGVESWKRHFAQADLVIEAVFEEISVKHKVRALVHALTALLASFTALTPTTAASTTGASGDGGGVAKTRDIRV